MADVKAKAQSLLALADITINGSRSWDPQIKNEQFYNRIFSQGSLGVGESYMDGWWEVEQLDEFFHKVLRARLETKIKPLSLVWFFLKASLSNRQSRSHSQGSAEYHYNIGNDFYEKMLDPFMQYTCGYWSSPTTPAQTLAQAQENKLDLVCRKIGIKPGQKILDLGGGWGGFAKFAAEKYGARVTLINISREQVAYARKINQGLPVEVILADYREAAKLPAQSFDHVASIGLCEHIGVKNYRSFFEIAARLLKPDGLFLLHTIGGNRSVRAIDPWIDKYIFPNSMLPSMRQLTRAYEGLFTMEDWHNISADYDKTLMAWFQNFDKHWSEIRTTDPKFDERFYRMWKYYLLACAGSFRARKNQLWQVVLSPRGVASGYRTVR
jgi:cyclopropane-fatty-acyl-phospholipid synthase